MQTSLKLILENTTAQQRPQDATKLEAYERKEKKKERRDKEDRS